MGTPFFSFSRMDDLLKQANLDAVLFCRPESYRYFTTMPWYERVHFSESRANERYVLPIAGYIRSRPGVSFATASKWDLADMLACSPWISDIRPIMEYKTLPWYGETILEILREKGVTSGRIGIERDMLPHETMKCLDSIPEAFEWVDSTQLLLKLQEFKSEAEIRLLRESCRRTAKGFREVLNSLAPGVTGEQMMDVFTRAVAGLYVAPYGHFFPIHFGDNHFTGKVIAGNTLQPETLIHMDTGISYKGLISDMGRNFYFGNKVPPIVERYSAACIRMVKVVADELHPGIACAKAHERSTEVFYDALGNIDTEDAVCGFHSHGLGWTLYSYPHISIPEPRGEILPGHAFTLEVKARVAGIGHFKCEDSFVMQDTGVECLSQLERKLFVRNP